MLVLWLCLLAVFSLSVAVSDFRFRRIPNRWLLGALAVQAGWMVLAALGQVPAAGAGSWKQALTGFAVGLLLFFPLWRFGAMGAADVKLTAVLGFVLGLHGLWPVLLSGSLLLGGHVAVVAARGGWRQARTQWAQGTGRRRGLPYGAWLALAALAWVVWETYG